MVPIVTVKPVPCATPAPPTSPKIKVSDASNAVPGDVTDIALQKPTLVTVNWNPDPPPPPTVASSTLRTSFARYPAPFNDIFETVAIPVFF